MRAAVAAAFDAAYAEAYDAGMRRKLGLRAGEYTSPACAALMRRKLGLRTYI